MIRSYSAVFSLIFPAILAFSQSSKAQTETTPAERKEGSKVRIVCVQNLGGGKKADKLTLAKKSKDDEWIEFGDIELRASTITNWVRVPNEEIHVIRKGGENAVSLGSFTIPPKVNRAVLILIPNPKEKIYRVHLIDPAKLEFRNGKALVVNYTKIPAMVNMGQKTKIVTPGQEYVEDIKTDKDGMFRMLIAYKDKEDKVIPCYDRALSADDKTRKFILLLPDSRIGMQAISLTEFDTTD